MLIVLPGNIYTTYIYIKYILLIYTFINISIHYTYQIHALRLRKGI
jgi:hypothetical protein